mmetsp:Transcript_22477/g.36190  ORF Transcript_22477/g.36190 Transcript_22477/m.36190 type:complete len:136 (+) Transcript_22477:1649-2056(+)
MTLTPEEYLAQREKQEGRPLIGNTCAALTIALAVSLVDQNEHYIRALSPFSLLLRRFCSFLFFLMRKEMPSVTTIYPLGYAVPEKHMERLPKLLLTSLSCCCAGMLIIIFHIVRKAFFPQGKLKLPTLAALKSVM